MGISSRLLVSSLLYSLCAIPARCAPQGDSYGSPGSPPSVTIDSGPIVGTTTQIDSPTVLANQYLGVPFAQSPPERFSLPSKPKKWKKPLLTQARKAACIQRFAPATAALSKQLYDKTPVESEDCLYLNVFTPAKRGKGRPVLVFFFGGSFNWGDASHPWYDGSSMAANQDVVVVVPNYRTNVFGYPNTTQIPLEKRNVGLYDHRQALEWVQNNAKEFGGDPDKVTIWGWSAGGSAVDKLILTNPKNPPFRAGIMDEGQSSYGAAPPTSPGPAPWDVLSKELGCDTKPDVLKCVKAADATKIRDIINRIPNTFVPINDEVTSLANPAKARREKRIAKVPIIIGANTDEGSIVSLPFNNATLAVSLFAPVNAAAQAKILAAYPLGQDGLTSERLIVQQVLTDIVQCSQSIFAHETSKVGIPAWRYSFAAAFANQNPTTLPLGAYHGHQIPLIFGTYPRSGATKTQIALSKALQRAYADFAKNPNRGPGWNRLDKSEKDLGLVGGKTKPEGIESVSERVTDRNCGLYASFLEPK